MRRLTKVLTTVSFLGLLFCAATMCGQQEKKGEPEKEKKAEVKLFQYIGAKKCKPCHFTKKHGEQYGKWEAGPHAGAYDTLASQEALEIGKKLKLKEEPQKSGECLVCHVTAYGVADSLKAETLTLEEGVSCEACHGPGSEYKSMKVMKAITAGTQAREEVGLIKPTEEVCVGCHNKKSPVFKGFKFDEYFKQIAHPIPPPPKKKE